MTRDPPHEQHEPEQFKAHRELFEGRRKMAGFCEWMKSRYRPDTVGKPATLLVLKPKPKTMRLASPPPSSAAPPQAEKSP